jgi:tRNA(fMet)-specific endonuclease VapC
MTGNNYIADSNIVIDIFNGNKKFADKFSGQKEILIPVIVIGELYTGINRVVNKAKHLKKLIDFLPLCKVINIDMDTAKIYGELVAALYRKGKPLPTNDIWIAATAIQHSLTVATKDNHFQEIDGLLLEIWE